MLISKRNIVSVILACLAMAAIASPASAVVQAGVVGGGIHNQYGPQDVGGNYMGIASESYDAYCDSFYGTGWGDAFPTWSGDQRPPDGIGFGYVLLAFDPYTGEVWNEIPAEHQALNVGGGYYGHTPTVGLTGLDAGGSPVASDVVVADLGRGYAEDCVYITGAFIPAPVGIFLEPFGSFVQTSSDGGILSTTGWPVYAGGSALMQPGEEVRPYAAGDPDRPDCYDPGDLGDLTFDQTKVWGHTGFWNPGGWYAGTNGGAADNLIGFEMDGIKGWMRLDFAADRTGVRLTEYYFDIVVVLGDFDEDGDIDAADINDLCANLTGSGVPAGDPKYDLDGDGDADQADMDMLIHDLVEIAGGGTGTEYADFNLDGEVNTTDLTILATNFGIGTTWAEGNANCDLVIDTTDLTIMATNFGFVASGAVPEPATLFVMGCGAIGLLRRCRSKIRRGGRA